MQYRNNSYTVFILYDASKFMSSGYRLDLYCEGDKNINTTNITISNNSNGKLSMIVFNKYGIYYWNSTTQIWGINHS